jgi:tetratricopeptide (TPR) repeat protein
VLDELYAITRLNKDKEINDNCYGVISQIHLSLEEYDKVLETIKKYGCKSRQLARRETAILTSLIAQNKIDEAEKHIHNSVFAAITQIFVNLMHYTKLAPNEFERNKKIQKSLINLSEIFQEDSPGPLDFYMITSFQVLGYLYYNAGEYAESVKHFEEMLNSIEKFKLFSESREITSEFFKLVDKDAVMYKAPFDFKKHLLTVFELFEKEESAKFAEMQEREDFKKFAEKLKD